MKVLSIYFNQSVLEMKMKKKISQQGNENQPSSSESSRVLKTPELESGSRWSWQRNVDGDCLALYRDDVLLLWPVSDQSGAWFGGATDVIENALNSHAALVAAGQKVLAGLNARIQAASDKDGVVPVFDGIADLHTALALVTTQETNSAASAGATDQG